MTDEELEAQKRREMVKQRLRELSEGGGAPDGQKAQSGKKPMGLLAKILLTLLAIVVLVPLTLFFVCLMGSHGGSHMF